MAKRVPVQIDTTVGDAINTMYSGIEQLGSELRDWYDNMPEGLQGGDKGSEVDDAATVLEDISEPDVPAAIREFPLMFRQLPLLKRATRSDRMSEALEYGRKAIELIEERITGLEENENRNEQEQEQLDELEALKTSVEDDIETAEGLDFPGAY